MAWNLIPNSGGWEWNDTPPDPGLDSPLRDLWLKQVGGIRTDANGHQVYVDCRNTTHLEYTATGELSKTYWDNRNAI